MRFLADLVYLLAGLLYLPIALYQAIVRGKNRRGWGQRFGFVPRFDPSRKRIWIHAVSLGEINATPKLVEMLRERWPNVDVVFSATTDTGFERAVKLYGADRVVRFPLDFSFVVNRALRRINPAMIVLIELEVWYNLVHSAARRGIPITIVNGRLTQRSAARFRRLGAFTRSMFHKLTWVGAQDEAIASRFQELGVPQDRIEITSSLKWDSASLTDHVPGQEALAHSLGLDRSRPVWVCGSTGPGEEEMILEAIRRRYFRQIVGTGTAQPTPHNETVPDPPIVVLVPRKPERFDEIAQLITRQGFTCIRRSTSPDGSRRAPLSTTDIVLGDTMGELRKLYALADIVFVGRSLVPLGGSDPMEVAALGKSMIVGPHTNNFSLPVGLLRQAQALQVVSSPEELIEAVACRLADPASARSEGARARDVVRENQGATERTAAALIRIFETASHQPSPTAVFPPIEPVHRRMNG